MIRRVLTAPDADGEREIVYGFTRKGVAAWAAEWAATLVAIVFALIALHNVHAETVNRIRATCEETNAHRAATISRLDAAIALTPAGPKRLEAERSRAVTVGLIDGLAPYHDCDARVVELTRR